MKVKELMKLLEKVEVKMRIPYYKGYSTTILKYEFQKNSDLYKFVFKKDYEVYKTIYGISYVLEDDEISNSEVLKIETMKFGEYINVSESGNRYWQEHNEVVIAIK